MKAQFIVGNSKNNLWSDVFGYIPDENKYLGEMFLVVKLETLSENVELDRLGKFIINFIQNSYYFEEDDSESLIERLENSLYKTKGKIQELVSREPDLIQKGLDFEMGLALFTKDANYFAIIGESKIYLSRENDFADISAALTDASSSGFMKTGSIDFNEGDKFLIATSLIVNVFDDLEIEQSVKNLDISILADSALESGLSVLLAASDSAAWTELEEEREEVEEQIKVEESAVNESTIELKEDILQEEEIEESNEYDEDLANQDEFEEEEKSKFNIKESLSNLVESSKDKLSKVVTFVKSKFITEEYDEEESEDSDDLDNDVVDALDTNTELPSDEDLTILDRIKTLFVDKLYKGIIIGKFVNHFKNNNKTYSHYIKSVVSRIKLMLSKAYELFKKEIIGTTDRRDFYRRSQRTKRNRIIFAVAVVLIIIFGYIFISNEQKRIAEENRVASIKSQLDDYNSRLSNLTNQVSISKDQSIERKTIILDSLDKLAKDAQKLKSENLFTSELDGLISSVSKQKDIIQLINKVNQNNVLVDIAGTIPDSKPSDLEYLNGFLYISDSAKGTIYKLNENTSTGFGAHVSGLTNPTLLTVTANNKLLVYDDNTISAIGKFDPNTPNSIERLAGLTRGEIGNVTEVELFGANGALYELKTNHQQIFKRSAVGSSFGGGGATFITTNPPNWKNEAYFGSALDIAVDGEVYLLINGRGIERYRLGGANSLTDANIKNVFSEDLSAIKNSPKAFDVKDKYIAVGVGGNNPQVLIFQKEDSNISLLAKFNSDAGLLNNIEEIKINESARKVYVLAGTKVIKLDF